MVHSLKVSKEGHLLMTRAFDYLVINITVVILLLTQNQGETIVDLGAGLLFSSVYILTAEYMQVYAIKSTHRFLSFVRRLFMALFLAELVFRVVQYCVFLLEPEGAANYNMTLQMHLFSLFLVAFVIILRHIIWSKYINYNAAQESKGRHIAIIGLTSIGIGMEKALHADLGKHTPDIVFYDNRGLERCGYITSGTYAGKIDQLMEDIAADKVLKVYVALPMQAKDHIQSILLKLSNSTIDVYLVPDLYSYKLHVSQIHTIQRVSTFSVFSSPFEGMGALVKRIEDIVIGSLITLLILPVLAVVAIGVKVTSKGPILFKQDRYGLGGKRIKVWKFRSMKVMENSEVVTQATKNDPRVTKFGGFLRRTSLDELPQFFNVIMGQMSIVGPRPHAVSHNEQYRQIVDHYMVRHKIKPGITGLAQIKGFRGETDTIDKMEKRVYYDIEYMQTWSLWQDIKIIFFTVFKGFTSDTAY